MGLQARSLNPSPDKLNHSRVRHKGQLRTARRGRQRVEKFERGRHPAGIPQRRKRALQHGGRGWPAVSSSTWLRGPCRMKKMRLNSTPPGAAKRSSPCQGLPYSRKAPFRRRTMTRSSLRISQKYLRPPAPLLSPRPIPRRTRCRGRGWKSRSHPKEYAPSRRADWMMV